LEQLRGKRCLLESPNCGEKPDHVTAVRHNLQQIVNGSGPGHAGLLIRGRTRSETLPPCSHMLIEGQK
jgi:hypothetical protein